MAQPAEGVADVGGDAIDPGQSALIPHRLGGLGETSGQEQRLPPRRVRLHATADVLGGLHVEMGLQLVLKIVVGPVAGEESRDAREQGTKRSHGTSGRGPRKSAIRSAVRCQSRASRASCLRPAAVSA